MRFLIIFLLFITPCFAQDVVDVQVRFKQGIFECPGGDEIVDWNVSGGNKYEHTCKDGTWLNQFKEYNGTVRMPVADYAGTTQADIKVKKDKIVADWLHEVRNPPPYVEPSVKDYQNMLDEKIAEVSRLSDDMAKIATVEQMQEVKDKIDVQSAAVAVSVSEKASPIEEKPVEVIRK